MRSELTLFTSFHCHGFETDATEKIKYTNDKDQTMKSKYKKRERKEVLMPC